MGQGVSYSTIPPIFVRKLVQFVQDSGGECFITDHYVARRRPHERGYSEAGLGCPVLDDCGYFGKYFYTVEADYKKPVSYTHLHRHGCAVPPPLHRGGFR